jgi:PASTA domain/Glucodextranase, domain B
MSIRLLCLLVALGVAGCGGSPEPPKALPGVQLRVDGPRDASVTEGTSVLVTGTVTPAGATVLVGGDEAAVTDGRFSHSVDLEPGTNVVDVEAGAPRRPAAMTAVRVTREVPVEVPDVSGKAPDDARDQLQALGFVVQVKRGGGLFDELVPGSLGVCGTDPDAGERLRRGSTVTVEVRKTC